MLDPVALSELETQPMSPQNQFASRSSDLSKLLNAWGVEYEPSKVLADVEASSNVRSGDKIESNPIWLSLRKEHMAASDTVTAHIESMMLPYAGSFTLTDEVTAQAVPLLFSSQTSDMVEAMTAQFNPSAAMREFTSGLKPLNIAIRLHGKLKTAFPDGKPAGDGADSEVDQRESTPLTQALKESVGTSTVVLIGDTDMVYDRFCIREINLGFIRGHQPINDNLAFFFNMVEQLTGSSDLISIRTRGKTDRAFEVVLDLQRKAQEQHMEEERRLQAKLQEAQQRLNSLQSQRNI